MEEVAAAGQIKVEVESHGLSLELVLDISQEFAGHKNAKEKLAEGIKKHHSITKYLDELTEWGEKQRVTLKSGIAGLESQKKSLEGDRHHLDAVLSQLQTDITGEEELRRFFSSLRASSKVSKY